MLRVSYGLIGVFQAISGFLVYFVIMADHGFLPWTLFFLREQWDAKGVNDLQDSYGQEWVSNSFCAVCFISHDVRKAQAREYDNTHSV